MRTRAKLRQVGGGGARKEKVNVRVFSRNKKGGPGQGWDLRRNTRQELSPWEAVTRSRRRFSVGAEAINHRA